MLSNLFHFYNHDDYILIMLLLSLPNTLHISPPKKCTCKLDFSNSFWVNQTWLKPTSKKYGAKKTDYLCCQLQNRQVINFEQQNKIHCLSASLPFHVSSLPKISDHFSEDFFQLKHFFIGTPWLTHNYFSKHIASYFMT